MKVKSGENQTFTFTPDAGKTLDTLNVDGTAMTPPGTTYTFSKVTANHTIAVTFKPAPPPPPPPGTFTITATAGPGGKISPAGAVKVKSGENQTFTFTPDAGKAVDTLTVDGKGVTPTRDDLPLQQGGRKSHHCGHLQTGTTPAPTPGTFTITATAGTGGKISPPGAVTVKSGENQTFTFAPDAGKTRYPAWMDDGETTRNDLHLQQGDSKPTIAVTFKSGSGTGETIETIKKEIINLINKERTTRGLPPYARDPPANSAVS